MKRILIIAVMALGVGAAFGQTKLKLTTQMIKDCSSNEMVCSTMTWFTLEDNSKVLSLGDDTIIVAGSYTVEQNSFKYWNGYRYKKEYYQSDIMSNLSRSQLLTNDSDSSMILFRDRWFLPCATDYEQYMIEYKKLNPEYVAPDPIDTVRLHQIVKLVLKSSDEIANGMVEYQGGRLTGSKLTAWQSSTKKGLALTKEGWKVLDGTDLIDYMHWKKAAEYLEAVQIIKGSGILLSIPVD